VLILKLSNTCPVSKDLFEELQRRFEGDASSLLKRVHIVIVQDSREISKHIETKFGIVHESPQAILIENEDVFFYANHGTINPDTIFRS
jgi:bacillithiol system protein YtxJ